MPHLELEHRFKSPPSIVWRVVSDTEHLNRAAGLPPVVYRDEPQPDGRSRRFCKTGVLGLEIEYEELPFRWVRERWFEVTRIYSKGPIERLRYATTLEADGEGTRVRSTLEWTPRGHLDALVAAASMRQLGAKPLARAYARLDELLVEEAVRAPSDVEPLVYETASVAREDVVRRVRAFEPRVREILGEPSPYFPRLEQALSELGDGELARMQPKAFARRWQAALGDVSSLFLAATKAGVLSLRWDVICPHCRGDKENLTSLSDVRERAFCTACNLDFDVDLDRSLEVVFAPHPSVREVEHARYCLGGPGATPHVVLQSPLEPGQRDELAIVLAPGRYRLRVTGDRSYRWLDAAAEGAGRYAAVIADDHLEGDDAVLAAGANVAVSFESRARRPVVVALERVDWAKDALSAGELVAEQRFRDLFSREVLAPGVKLGVDSVTVMFTDLVGSTAMYQALGDARAFGLVWAHFDILREVVDAHLGAIVKTIGDAIMAVFMRPEDALLAADELHTRVGPRIRALGHEHPVSLKLGLHVGPCIAVTMNERLDYFGSTVNLAARVEAQSEGNDIVVSRELAERTGDAEALRARGWTAEALSARAKGFREPIALVRFTR